jgi:glycosyltransferase involved in cell wall biosynthesis
MKILQLIDLYKTGGAEKVYDMFYAYGVDRRDEIIRMVLYRCEAKAGIKFLIKNEHASLIKKAADQFFSIHAIRREIRLRRIDTVISFLDRSNLAVVFACLFFWRRPQIILTVHNPPSVQYLKLRLGVRKIFFDVLAWAYNRSWVKVIAVSQAVKDSMESIGVKRIVIVHNPVGMIAVKSDGATVKNLGDYLIAAGRLDYQKAHWKLIKAFFCYKKAHPEDSVKLYILGEGSFEKNLREMYGGLEVSSDIVFCGYKSNALEYIQNAAGMIFSSFYEGFPVSLLECMALRKPFIGSEAAIPVEIRKVLAEKHIVNTYKTISVSIDFDITHINQDEKDLADLICRIRTEKMFSEIIAETGYDWVYKNCPLSNFDKYLA